MTATLTYILKWALSLAVLYLPFALLLRKETFSTLNRRLLLCIIIVSALLPSIIVSYPVKVVLQSEVPATPIVNEHTKIENLHTETNDFRVTARIKDFVTARHIFIIYTIGTIVSLLLCAVSLIKTMRGIKRGTIWIDKQKGMTIYCHIDNTAPFSLFRNVVISQSDYEEFGKEILLHEEGHIKNRHSYDMLLISIVKSLQWFNPFIYLLANDIKEIHEYEADKYVLQQHCDAQAYQLLILKKATGTALFPLANNFSQSCIRKRIKMMARKESSSIRRCKTLYLLPVSIACVGAFAQPEYVYIAPPVAAQQQDTSNEHTTTDIDEQRPPYICLPALEKEGIAYVKYSPKRIPKTIEKIEPPVIREERLYADSYCEYIDLENSNVADALRASGIRKCDIKVRFTTSKDGKANDISIASCNVTTTGNATPTEIEQIKSTATAATIKHINGRQWHTDKKTQYDARIIYHYGPSMEIAGNNALLPLMAGSTAIR